MFVHPEFDAVAFSIGPISVHWYGLMYLLGFAAAWWLGRLRMQAKRTSFAPREMDDIVFVVALGVILGGRIGYVFFYNLGDFLANPLTIFQVWQGGMSFHGGLIGVIVAMWLYARRKGLHFFVVADFVAPLVPIGLGAGRIGNFINGNLWGSTTTVPWGVVFRGAGELPRHPSQLYEAFFEGLVLFIALWWLSSRRQRIGLISGWFLLLYGVFRFSVEFVRQPDSHIGYMAFDWVTRGQVLTVPMLLLGAFLLWWSRRQDYPPTKAELAALEGDPQAPPSDIKQTKRKRRRKRR